MSHDPDRRQFPRRPLSENVFAYLDGKRFNIRSVNVSVSGLFLATDQVDQIPLGARFAMVFNRKEDEDKHIFMVACVVRRQFEQPSGVGLAWEKAVTARSAEHLAQFLNRLIKVRVEVIEKRIVQQAEDAQFVYTFSAPQPAPQGTLRPVKVVEVPRAAAPLAAPGPMPSEAATPAPAPEERGFEGPGPVTMQLEEQGVRVPVDLRGSLHLQTLRLPGQVVALGLNGATLSVESPVRPTAGETVTLVVGIPVGRSVVQVNCPGQVDEVNDAPAGGLLVGVRLEPLEEDVEFDILRRYVRWMRVRAVQDA